MWHTGCSPGGLALPPVGATLVPAPETLTVHPVGLGPMPLGGQLTHGPTLSPCSSLPARPSFPSAQLDLYLELKWSLHRAAHWHWPELVGWTEMPAPYAQLGQVMTTKSVTGVLSSGSWRCLATSVHIWLPVSRMVGLPTISSASAGLGGTGQLSLPSQAFLAPMAPSISWPPLGTSCQSLAGSWETWVNTEQSCPERPLEAPLTIWSVNEAPTPACGPGRRVCP